MIGRCNSENIINQKFVKVNDNCFKMTDDFKDINKYLSYWDIVVDNPPDIECYLPTEYEQQWLRESIYLSEMEFVDDEDKKQLTGSQRDAEIIFKSLKNIKSLKNVKSHIKITKALLHLCYFLSFFLLFFSISSTSLKKASCIGLNFCNCSIYCSSEIFFVVNVPMAFF